MGLVIRAVSFFESDYFALEQGAVKQLPLPRSADVKGVFDGAWIATLRQPFDSDGVSLPKGALVAFREGAQPQVIFAPGPRQSIESVGIGRDRIYAAITDNVIGAVHVFTATAKGWSDKVLTLPGAGTADIVSTNDFGPQVARGFGRRDRHLVYIALPGGTSGGLVSSQATGIGIVVLDMEQGESFATPIGRQAAAALSRPGVR